LTRTFLDSFCRKGRFADMMKKIPVFVILNGEASLIGSALVAARALYPGTPFCLPREEGPT
jgi:glucokinase